MNAPRYSTADIAKNAQSAERDREREQTERERDRDRGEVRERLENRENKEPQRVDAVRQESAEREAVQRANTTAHTAAVTGAAAAATGAAAATAPARPAAAVRTGAPGDTAEMNAALFAPDAAQGFRTRWDTIQASFVDDPRRAVQEADALVAETMQRLADTFAKERAHLEQQFDRDTNVSTEDLRVTLRHYRSFFTRLLAV